MIGKESVVKESLSASGSRYAVALNNLNASSQEVARELMNPDELMKLPPTEALILNQGMPAYIAKKVVYYMDKRFKDNPWSRQPVKRLKRLGFIPLPFITELREKTTGFMPPSTRKELELELAGLPSALKKAAERSLPLPRPKAEAVVQPDPAGEETPGEFNPIDYLESYDSLAGFPAPPRQDNEDGEARPLVVPFNVRRFPQEDDRG
jgi:hypothetical protein